MSTYFRKSGRFSDQRMVTACQDRHPFEFGETSDIRARQLNCVHGTGIRSRPMRRGRKQRRAAASCCCRRFSASPRISGTSATASRRRAIMSWRRRCSIASDPASSSAIRRRMHTTGRDLREPRAVGCGVHRCRGGTAISERQRQGRNARILLGRDRIVALPRRNSTALRQRSATTPRRSALRRRKAALPGADAFRRERSDRDARSTPGSCARRRVRRSRSRSIRPATASIATTSPASTRPARRSRCGAPWTFCRPISARQPAHDSGP